MKIIIWNVNGAPSKEFIRTAKEIIMTHEPSFFRHPRNKVSGVKADKICNKIGFDQWLRVEALGFSGGIWIFWNNCTQIQALKQFIHLQIKHGHYRSWLFSVVYGSPPPHYEECFGRT